MFVSLIDASLSVELSEVFVCLKACSTGFQFDVVLELIEQKNELTILTRQQIEEQMALEDDSYRLLLEKREQLKLKSVLTEEERAELEKNQQDILEKEDVWKESKGVEEQQQKKQSLLSKAFTTTC